jgi:hypothetical protein
MLCPISSSIRCGPHALMWHRPIWWAVVVMHWDQAVPWFVLLGNVPLPLTLTMSHYMFRWVGPQPRNRSLKRNRDLFLLTSFYRNFKLGLLGQYVFVKSGSILFKCCWMAGWAPRHKSCKHWSPAHFCFLRGQGIVPSRLKPDPLHDNQL